MTLRALYLGLLRLHPEGFRQRYGDEMLWIFDEAAARGNAAPLFADALKSLCRQWLLRPGFTPPDRTPQAADGAPAFVGLESHGLSRSAILNGALISALSFAGVLYCANHGEGHWEGVQRIFYTLEAASWNAAEKAQPVADEDGSDDVTLAYAPDTVDALVTRIMMLDGNGDGKISKTERRGWIEREYYELLDHVYMNRDGDITEEALRRQTLWRLQQGWTIPERPKFLGKR